MNNLNEVILIINNPEFLDLYQRAHSFIYQDGDILTPDEYRRLMGYLVRIRQNEEHYHPEILESKKFDKFLQIYSIYRDHIKHEDTLGNQRLSFLIASQSFLFFPYFTTYKDYRANGYNGFDCSLLVVICFVGLLLSFSSRHTVRAFVVAAHEIAEEWKKNYWDEYPKQQTPAEKKKTGTEQESGCLQFSQYQRGIPIDNEAKNEHSIAFIKIKEKVIPNIRYETNSRFLLWGIRKFSNTIPMQFIIIWILLGVLAVFLHCSQFGLEEQTKVDLYKSLTETRQELKMKEKASEDTIENLTALQNQLNTSQEKTRNLMIEGRKLKTNLDNKERQSSDLIKIIIRNSCQTQINKQPNFINNSLNELKDKEPDKIEEYVKENCNE